MVCPQPESWTQSPSPEPHRAGRARVPMDDRLPISGGTMRRFYVREAAVAVFLGLLAAPAPAQWITYPTPGIPRTPDGKPNLKAPAPRTSDGKPDLSGVWQPELNPYRFDVIQDLKDEVIFKPAAEAFFQARVK